MTGSSPTYSERSKMQDGLLWLLAALLVLAAPLAAEHKLRASDQAWQQARSAPLF